MANRATAKKTAKKSAKAPAKSQRSVSREESENGSSKYPRHVIDKVLRIPKAILDQNAGRECTKKESADFTGVSYNGRFEMELSSATKMGC